MDKVITETFLNTIYVLIAIGIFYQICKLLYRTSAFHEDEMHTTKANIYFIDGKYYIKQRIGWLLIFPIWVWLKEYKSQGFEDYSTNRMEFNNLRSAEYCIEREKEDAKQKRKREIVKKKVKSYH